MMFSKEKRKLEVKIIKLSDVNIAKFSPASRKLFTMYLSTLINESLMLDMLEAATVVDERLEEAFTDVERD